MFRYHRHMGGGRSKHKRFEKIHGGQQQRSRAGVNKFLASERERRRVRRRTHRRLKHEFQQNVARGKIRLLPNAKPRRKVIIKAVEELGLSADVQNLLGIHFSPHKIAFGSSLFRGHRFPVDASKLGATNTIHQAPNFSNKFSAGVRETSFTYKYRNINRLPDYDIWDPLKVEQRKSWLELHGQSRQKASLINREQKQHDGVIIPTDATKTAGGGADAENSQHALPINATQPVAVDAADAVQAVAVAAGGVAPRVDRSVAVLAARSRLRENRTRQPTFYTYAGSLFLPAKTPTKRPPTVTPFGVKCKRFTPSPDSSRKTPGPGRYEVVNVRLGRNVVQAQQQVSSRTQRPAVLASDGVCCSEDEHHRKTDLFRTGTLDIYYRCSPYKTDKCQCCSTQLGVDLNEYYFWNDAERIGLCRACYHMEQSRPYMLTPSELKRFGKVRDCSFVHRHVIGTRQHITLLPLKILKHYERKQLYFSLFCDD